MKVKELIEDLELMDQDADVSHLWDGALRTDINIVYMSKDGRCVTSDYDMICYTDASRSINAPDVKKDAHWRTQQDPNLEGE